MSGLIALFHAKELGEALHKIPYLVNILQNSSNKKSVWYLKAFVMARDAELILLSPVNMVFSIAKQRMRGWN